MRIMSLNFTLLGDFPMSLTDLASLGSFVSGIAVLASLIFVGFQMRQNTQAVKAAASQAHSANYHQLVSHIIEHADVARIWRRGLEQFDSLTDDERVRFLVFLSGAFRFFEATRLQWRHGQLDSEHWHNVESNVRDLAPHPGVKTYWTIRHHWHSIEFRGWFESLPQTVATSVLYGESTETPSNASTQ